MVNTARSKKPSAPSAAEAPAATPERPAGNGKRRMQMTDIARMAGVSASTVSRALSGSPLIPEATRVRITELARSLNYRVNVGAANLRKREVQTIGVVILGDSMQMISDPFLLSILGSVADTLDERGMSLLLTRLKDNRKHVLSDLVESGQVGGLIVIGQLTLHDYLNDLTRNGFPMVVWGANLPDALYPVVGGDNAQGGYLATRHLIEHGCRRIAFFGDISHPEAGQRYQGYARALQEAGIEQDPRLLQSFLFGDTRIRQVIDGWLDQQLGFDAIFASSDVTAISLMGSLNERGIAIPSQVRLVGYDDIALAEHVHPTLSTIRQPTAEAGRALVDLLFEALAGQPRRAIVLPAELIRRESSA
ncbi:substrate-binding domain-containing protein [Hydrogenophaga sp.]|uniref:LacI family DNA-binding transcriptional regulator n=1 Tax=Hydrogenophaga sp. TaxID=1904254 RepID=UPI00286EAAF6|nr:substrate-binding domain-containing protein [Hydrogenophaga sp.]